MKRLHQPVLALLAFAVLAALLGLGVLSHAPNRLISGQPLGLMAAFGWLRSCALLGLVIVLAGAAFLPASAGLSRAVAVASAVALVLLLEAAGAGAARLAEGAAPAARTSLGAGFWIAAVGLGLILADAVRRVDAGMGFRGALLIALAAAALSLAAAGALDQLSLAREYTVRRDVFRQELLRHLVIAGLALLPALALGSMLGLLLHGRARLRGPVFAALDMVQVVPAIALFALMMAPLAALARRFPVLGDLGVGGIGAAPAVVALVLYLLLPIARTVHAGLAAVDPAVTEAARGMGFSKRRLLLDIEAPLALPVFLAGLRVAVVQAIGLATLAALVGGGGLGAFVFQGMSQFALDLVLLGVLPVAALTAIADIGLRAAETALRPEGA